MTTIYLIRHGQKQPHAGDPGLTDIGIKQAKQTGEYPKTSSATDWDFSVASLKGMNQKMIYSNSLAKKNPRNLNPNLILSLEQNMSITTLFKWLG